MTIKTTEQFINLIYAPVIDCCKKHGWGVPSAIIAQACLESMKANGWSGLASTCYNFWGMKWNKKYGCDYKEYKTSEQRKDGAYYTVTSKFNKYPTVEAGVDGYFIFIEKNPRYKKVMECKDFVSYATEIKNADWATSLKYTQNIINKVLSLNLQRFDVMLGTSALYQIGRTYTTQQDLNVREAPNGKKLPFEALTDNAKEHAMIGTSGEGILKRGTQVTVKDVVIDNGCTWLKIPSGWICGKNSKYIYVL
jgi:hypothetical protein